MRLSQSLKALFEQKKFAEIGDACRTMIELVPRAAEPHYNLACSQARLGKKEDALATLAKAIELGFEDSALIEKDDDLASLHAEPRFRELLAKAKASDEGRTEKGSEIAGVKTIEGSPPEGLRFRVRMSPATTKEKPQRLMIWMHPSGGSMDAAVEKLAPRFNKHGFALVVFTKKNYASWTAADAARMPQTLDALAAIEGLSDERPVLIGFSAGGQMALMMWHAKGAGLGGMVLDAAYPVQMGQGGKFSVMDIPKDVETRKVPLFVLVGLKDGGSQVWKQMEPAFKQAGTPLTVSYIEGHGHEWLFGNGELDALDKWLDGLEKTPGAKSSGKNWRPKLE
jgi:predicted esterase